MPRPKGSVADHVTEEVPPKPKPTKPKPKVMQRAVVGAPRHHEVSALLIQGALARDVQVAGFRSLRSDKDKPAEEEKPAEQEEKPAKKSVLAEVEPVEEEKSSFLLVRDRLIADAERMGVSADELLARLVGIRGDESQLAAMLCNQEIRKPTTLLPDTGYQGGNLIAALIPELLGKQGGEVKEEPDPLGFFEDTSQKDQAAHIRSKPEVAAAIAAELDHQMMSHLIEAGVDPTEIIGDDVTRPEHPDYRSSDDDSVGTTTRKMQARRARDRRGRRGAIDSTSSSNPTITSGESMILRQELQSRIKQEPEPEAEAAAAPAPLSPTSPASAITTIIRDQEEDQSPQEEE